MYEGLGFQNQSGKDTETCKREDETGRARPKREAVYKEKTQQLETTKLHTGILDMQQRRLPGVGLAAQEREGG